MTQRFSAPALLSLLFLAGAAGIASGQDSASDDSTPIQDSTVEPTDTGNSLSGNPDSASEATLSEAAPDAEPEGADTQTSDTETATQGDAAAETGATEPVGENDAEPGLADADPQTQPEAEADGHGSFLGVLPEVTFDAMPEGDADEEDFITRLTEEQERNITDRAFPLDAAIWPFPEIFVCWEEMPPEFEAQRAAVRDAITQSWQAASALDFFGWGQCSAEASGVRIAVRDVGPHVKGLGQFVDGKPEGMVLNFVYENWSPGCQDQQDYCNRVIAVHEFGHAIGFAHEQNRPDTPGECDQVQGTIGDNTSLTPWDPDSVMNYCNPVYANGGELSALDVAAVQYIYGK